MRLVFIDDDNSANFYHKIIVKEYGKIDDFVFYNKPEEGLAFLLDNIEKRDERDILFLDLNMPRLDGWQLLDKLIDAGVDTPQIVILSTSENPDHIERARQHPLVTGFINKPLTVQVLSDVQVGKFSFPEPKSDFFF